MALTARAEGRAGLETLLHRLLQWQVRARWFVFAAGYMAAIKLPAALFYRVGTGTWPRFDSTPWYVMAATIVISPPVPGGRGDRV
jgi:hypothetical protein